MKIEKIKQEFKSINQEDYPELKNYKAEEIYKGNMGIGALYLVVEMARRLKLKNGLRVMDLGCGKGASSIYLAKEQNLKVFAVDLWINSTDIYKEIEFHKMEDKITPLNLDITKSYPFAEEYFDIIFCMNAFHYFGGNEGFLKHLSKSLRKNGMICIGNTCFDRELNYNKIPEVYKSSWKEEFSKYHSPSWWKELFTATRLFKEIDSKKMNNGQQLWEDELLYRIKKGEMENVEADADEIMFGRNNKNYPYLTVFILAAKKK